MTRTLLAAGVFCLLAAAGAAAQEPATPQPLSASDLSAAIDNLGKLDYDTRTAASRAIRRTPGVEAVPALLQAVREHADGYVRYRALVLLTGFGDPRIKDAMREALTSPNDRLRAVAYSFFERNPDPALIPQFLGALDTENGEFVRPSLVRALAALGRSFEASPAVHGDVLKIEQALIKESGRGEDFFRSVVIEALGDYKAQYAYETLTAIANLDGPLQEDSAIALGKIGDKRALETLAMLQRTAARSRQPAIAAAICLLGVNCEAHEDYLVQTLKFSNQNPGYQDLLRGAASGLASIALAGHADAAGSLFDVGIPAKDDSTRAPVALAVATIALRNPEMFDALLSERQDRADAIELVAEGFDMLEEDLDKERFFAFARKSYWAAPEGSETRALMQTLIGKLDF